MLASRRTSHYLVSATPAQTTKGKNREIYWTCCGGDGLRPCVPNCGTDSGDPKGQNRTQSQEANHAKGTPEVACGYMGRQLPNLVSTRSARGRIESEGRNPPAARRALHSSHVPGHEQGQPNARRADNRIRQTS